MRSRAGGLFDKQKWGNDRDIAEATKAKVQVEPGRLPLAPAAFEVAIKQKPVIPNRIGAGEAISGTAIGESAHKACDRKRQPRRWVATHGAELGVARVRPREGGVFSATAMTH